MPPVPKVPEWQQPPEGKWRGGTCPKAPEFDGDIEKDVACLRTWKKEIKIWRMRARHHLPPNELAIDLLQALKGRAKREVENLDPEDFNVEDGIEKLIAVFEVTCKEQVVIRQSIAIKKYEELSRQPSQSITKYLAVWRDAESHLKSAGIMGYPDEVRASRLLEGAKIGDYARQLVLNSAGNRYDAEKIAEALATHFPAWTPGKSIRSSTGTRPPAQKGSKGRGRGGRSGSWRGFLTGTAEADEEEDGENYQDAAEGPGENQKQRPALPRPPPTRSPQPQTS